MRRVIAAAPLLLLSLCAGAPAAADATDPSLWDHLAPVVQREMRDTGTPGAVVAIVRGRRVDIQGFGKSSVETPGAPGAGTVFRLGSTTKMLVATALLSAMAARGLAADTPASAVAPDLDPALGRVTVGQLLSHTAGIAETEQPPARLDEAALADNVRTWHAEHLFTEPGDVYSYASSGYWLAGYLLERVTGERFADAMNDLVFAPLGMTRSTLRPTLAMTFPLAQGHERGPNGTAVVVRPFVENVPTWPGGSIFSTAADLSRFACAFTGGGRLDGRQAIPGPVVQALTSPHAQMPGGASYTYGLVTYEQGGVRIFEHGGARRGFGSLIRMVPARQFAVIALANASNVNLRQTVEAATQLSLSLATDAPPGRRPEALPVDEPFATLVVGRYENGPVRYAVERRAPGELVLVSDNVVKPLRRTGEREIAVGSGDGEAWLIVEGRHGAVYLHDGLMALRRVSPRQP